MTHPPAASPALRDRLLSWLHSRANEMAEFLAALVAIPTENPPGRNYRPCVDLLTKRVCDSGLTCERLEFRPAPASTHMDEDLAGHEAASLIATHGNGEPSLYFHGHYDVVPAQSPAQFESIRRDHFLFGRGSGDMKGGIVAMLYAVRALRELGMSLNGKIVLTLVPDEETGGARGSKWLAQQGVLGKNGIGMLLPEPTGGSVWNANRGAITFRIDVLGKSAHVGLQHHGQNAFERMLRVVERLQKLKNEVEQRVTSSTIGVQQSPHSILLLGGESGSGSNFNVVPERCWFTLDRRINPEENLDEEKNRIVEVLEHCRVDGIPLHWEILQEGTSCHSHQNERLAIALRHSVETVTGQSPQFEMCPGLLEIRFYAAQRIPAYAYGPGLLSVAHGPDEYVDMRRVRDCAAIYALTALQMLNC